MGVLFTTNDGYSSMCGHATIALGRFLVDTHDTDVFPQRDSVNFNAKDKIASLVFHAPCGLVEITVPTTADGSCSDPTRPVSHISVPSFATGLGVNIGITSQYRWPELGDRESVTADFSYGGAFYCLISATELGFDKGLKGNADIAAMNTATRRLKAAVNDNPHLRYLFSHPEHQDLGFLYSIVIVDGQTGVPMAGTAKAETGLCFFSDQQVAARVALAYSQNRNSDMISTTYHSLLSNSLGGQGGFIGSFHEEIDTKD